MKKLLLIFILLMFVTQVAAEEWAGADEKAEDAIKELKPDYEPGSARSLSLQAERLRACFSVFRLQ